MPLHNGDVARAFSRMADLLDIEGANPFRIRSYRNAAQTISGFSGSVADLIEKGEDLRKLPGIGRDLAAKIEELFRTGTLKQLEELEKRINPQLIDLLQIDSLGPLRVKKLRQELKIENLQDLENAVRENEVRKVKGFGAKTEQKILRDLARIKKGQREHRLLWSEMEEYALPLIEYLKQLSRVDRIVVAGSYRRKKETVGDLDILVACKDGEAVMDHFTSYEDVHQVISKGETRSSVVLKSNVQVDLRVLPLESFGAAMHYFTGSKAHNIAVRKMAVKKGLKLNEYGVFKGRKRIAGKDEEEVFAEVGLPYIEPELRENRGEIEAARKGSLPKLVSLEDIKGDLQVHTKASDGKFSLAEMVEEARRKGYEYIAITDHSKRVTMAGGLDEKRLARQIREIDKLNSKVKGIRILKSSEVDILKDGSLDLPDGILGELDLVLCSVHYNTNLPKNQQTERIIRAMDNPYFNILAHPTGRLIGSREPYELDLEKIMRAAKERGCFLEINANPERLDLDDVYAKMGKEIGLKMSISTDAHVLSGLDDMRYGVAQARRGWLEPEDVLNTRSWRDLEKLLKRK
jgi:DNA polymerase (family 10)